MTIQEYITSREEEFENFLIGENGMLIDNPEERLPEISAFHSETISTVLTMVREIGEKKKYCDYHGSDYENSCSHCVHAKWYNKSLDDFLSSLPPLDK